MAAALSSLVEAFELDEVQDAEHEDNGADGNERRMDHDVTLSPKQCDLARS
ncbi:MAG: hypothetical protein Q8S09_02100 [Hyphomonas sp.]|nr:hypothetical protein [Hyphomonas sp.]